MIYLNSNLVFFYTITRDLTMLFFNILKILSDEEAILEHELVLKYIIVLTHITILTCINVRSLLPSLSWKYLYWLMML